MGKIRIGLSGWSYDSWRGEFYPDDLPRSRQLGYLASVFPTVEVNGSFYSLLSPKNYRSWSEQVPADFCFAIKGSRFLTHNKKLEDADQPLANFLASGLLALDAKLGPILWQLPDHLAVDLDRLERFLDLLPRDTETAARLARRHDDRVKEAVTRVGKNRRMRHALEVRHRESLGEELVRVARRAGIALVFSHAGDWPYHEEITAGWVYLRLHGSPQTYASPYDDAALDRWAERARAWHEASEPPDARTLTDLDPPERKSRDVYVYFDNDQQGHAPRDARRLAMMLGVSVADGCPSALR